MLLGRLLPVADTSLFAFTFSRCVLAARVACFQFISFFVVILDTRFVQFYASFVYGSLCTIFEFPVEILRCDVEKCQRRLCGSEQSISIFGTPIANREVGSILQQVLRQLRNTWINRLFEIIDNYFFSNISHSRDILQRFSHDQPKYLCKFIFL